MLALGALLSALVAALWPTALSASPSPEGGAPAVVAAVPVAAVPARDPGAPGLPAEAAEPPEPAGAAATGAPLDAGPSADPADLAVSDEPPDPAEPTASDESADSVLPPGGYSSTVTAVRPRPPEVVGGRATEHTTRRQVQERHARSTPAALTYTPGVYVQQTSHAQASPYIRGLTGRRTLLLFDGLPLNHALFRQGPNQYLFTVDARTVQRLEVVRGSAGVQLGASAMGGAVLVHPLEPLVDPGATGVHLTPRLEYRHTTADAEEGVRAQLDTQLGASTGLLVGAGWRSVGQLEAAGPVDGLRPYASADDRARREVPRFEEDGRTQMGTGFEEITGDLRLVHHLSEQERLVLATYLYRQFDAPRTDQCPPPEAPDGWCLTYEEQFRTHAYAKAELRPGWTPLLRLDVSAGYQRQHERRSNATVFVNGGVDDDDMWALRVSAATRPLALTPRLSLEVLYGVDGTWEQIGSQAWTTMDFSRVLPGSDTVITRHRSRGQYVDGSRYARAGAWTAAHLALPAALSLRLGGRLSGASAAVPDDASSETQGLDDAWFAAVGQAGATWQPWPTLGIFTSLEQGFRPPNLDDLSGRQITGQGYQIDNPGLRPERTLTLDLGARWSGSWLDLEAWVFRTRGEDWIDRSDATCPPSLQRECAAARWAPPVQLVNLPGEAIIRGAEAQGRLRLPARLQLAATLSYAWGEGDSPLAHERGQRRPLSRIPPLNGTVELRWREPRSGLYLAAATRWAGDQDRLSYGDESDSRIPPGGTPGYAVHDLRLGVRRPGRFAVHAALVNVTDVAYRVHGSSVNGAGRGLSLNLAVEL